MKTDQPKPTTGEWHGQIHDDREHDGEPTGEWTAATVAEYEGAPDCYQRLADAHNVAVKEAYRKGYDDALETR